MISRYAVDPRKSISGTFRPDRGSRLSIRTFERIFCTIFIAFRGLLIAMNSEMLSRSLSATDVHAILCILRFAQAIAELLDHAIEDFLILR